MAEIAGRRICAFEADSMAEAENFLGEGWLRSDLFGLEDESGSAVWDGRQDIQVRHPQPEESDRYLTAKAAACAEAGVCVPKADLLVFLIPVQDLTTPCAEHHTIH